MSLTTDGSLYFEILDDGTTRSDHSAVIQLAMTRATATRDTCSRRQTWRTSAATATAS